MSQTPPAGPARVEPPAIPGVNGLLALATGVVVVAALYLGRDVFIPIVLAVILSFVLAPLVRLLRRTLLPRVLAVIVAVLLALGVLGALSAVIATQVAELAADLPRYQTTMERKVDDLRGATVGRLSGIMHEVSRSMAKMGPGAAGSAAAPQPGEPATEKVMPVEIRPPPSSPLEVARSVLSPILHPLETVGLVLVVAIFILLQQDDLRDRMIRLFGSRDLHRTTMAMDDAARRLSKYFLTQLALNSAFGVVIGIGLWLIGVPSPILWAVLSALLRFVPYIGALISAVLPIALAAAVDPGWSMVGWTVALYLISEPLMGHVIEPMVYGHSTGMSPFAVIVAAIFWTWLWGPIGLVLSTPFTVCLVVLGRHVDRLEFLDVLLGDRPALTPVENFYQRVLAGDPDEVRENAELLLKDRSLSSYYDEVALKGLQLAAGDATRGVLTGQQLETIRTAIRHLVEDLDDHDDVEPETKHGDDGPAQPPKQERALDAKPALPAGVRDVTADADWHRDGAVLCIAGRGQLDEAASRLLAQLLGKHGFGAGVVSHEAVSRGRLNDLPVEGVKMVCVSFLEISGDPAHLRYLLQRLRRRMPQARLLVGLWPTGEAILTNEELRKRVGADDYVTSLREALKACLAAAAATSAKAG